MSAEIAVAVKDLEKRFGSFVAVNRISFTVPAGEVFCFLGPNGAGKSTTIRMLCGILAPTGGSGTVAGFDIRTQPEAIKARIGYMSQRFSLYGDLTVEENIDFASGIYRVPPEKKRARKEWVLAMAGLEGHRNARTAVLAAGHKQRLALGCAIVHEPRILFLDEPTAGVDPVSRRAFWDLIYEVASRGSTVFVTTHYLDEAEYCGRLGLIYRGELIALGAPAAIKAGSMKDEVLEVLCSSPAEAAGEIERLPGVTEVALFGKALHVVGPSGEAAAARIRERLAQRGFAVERIEKIPPSLEDVFVSLVEARDRAGERGRESTDRTRTTSPGQPPLGQPDALGGAGSGSSPPSGGDRRGGDPSVSCCGRSPHGMRLRRICAICRKEFLHVLRDPRSLAMAIAIPLLQLLLYGYALTLDVDRVPTIVWDQSGTPASRDLIADVRGSRYFSIRSFAGSYAEIERAIDRGDALVSVIIPREFGEDLPAGLPAAVQVILDGSDSNTATIALGYIEAAVRLHERRIAVQHSLRLGGGQPEALVDLRPRAWFNEDMESKNFIIPGLIAVIMNVVAALLTSLTIAREWEMGTMEQLIATPVKAPEVVIGKLIPYFAIGMFDVALAVGMGKFLFEVPLRGSGALVFAMSSVFLIGTLAIGMLLSILTRNQILSSQLAMTFTYLPALLLSGFMFTIASMPDFLELVTYIVPARYFVKILKGIYLKGLGLEFLAIEAALLAAASLVLVLVAVAAFKKKLV